MNAAGCIGESPSNSRVARLARPASSWPLAARRGRRVRRVGRLRAARSTSVRSSSSASRPSVSFGSATRPSVDREVLGDLVGVEVDVHDLRAGREDALERGEDLGEDVRAADQHRVGLRRDRAAVRRRTCARAGRGRADASAAMLTSEEFAPQTSAPSSSATRVSSACAPEIGDAVAHDRRSAARRRRASRPPRATASALGATRVSGNDVGTTSSSSGASSTSIGSADEDRARIGGVAAILIARRSTRSVDDGSITRVAHFVTGLRHRDEVGGHLRVHRVVADAGLAGDHDERRVAALRLVHHPDPVAEADAAVQLDERRLLRRAGVAVGHRDRDRLLQRRDVPHVGVLAERVEEPLLDRAGVAEHVRDPVGEQLLDDREASRLGCHCGAAQAAPRRPRSDGTPTACRPVSSTSTIFCPVRYESGVERPVTNG